MLQSSATYQDGREAKVSQRSANDRPAHSPAHQTTRVTSRWFPSEFYFPRMFRQLFKRKDLFQCWSAFRLKVFVDDVKSIPWISRWPGFLIFVSGIELAPRASQREAASWQTGFHPEHVEKLGAARGIRTPDPIITNSVFAVNALRNSTNLDCLVNPQKCAYVITSYHVLEPFLLSPRYHKGVLIGSQNAHRQGRVGAEI